MLTKFTKIVLDIMYYVGFVITLTIPLSFHFLGAYYPNIANHYVPMCIIFMICGVLSLCIFFELRKMFKTVIQEDCFVERNVVSLRRMGCASFLICLTSIVRLFVVITPATLMIIIVFFIAGLFSFVLSQVFAQAVSYKQENDFTI